MGRGDGGWGEGAGGMAWRRTGDGEGGPLEGKVDVDKGGNGEDVGRVLGVVDEVALAGLVFGIPFEDVELKVMMNMLVLRTKVQMRG